MAINTSIDFAVNRDDIITEALEQIGVLGEGETPTTDQITSSARTLNMMIKAWQADGLNLFAVDRVFLFLEKLQEEYTLSSTTTDRYTDSFTETTTSADATALDLVITLSSSTGIANGDTIGIINGTDSHWTTVASFAGNDVVLSAALPFSVSSGSTVYFFTDRTNRPMKIMESYIHIATSDTDIPMGNISRRRYNRLSVKATEGVTNQFYYDPQIGDGNLFVWPTAQSEADYLIMFVQRTLGDLDTISDNPDYPQEWFLPLALNLAVLIAPKYGVPDQEYFKVRQQAEMYYEMAREFDAETYTNIYFSPDYRGEEI